MLKRGAEATDVDIMVLTDHTLYLIECKHSITPTGAHELAVVLDGMDLTDVQWAVLEPTFRPRRRPDRRGRPWTDPRAAPAR